LPDLFTKNTWQVLGALNDKVNRQLHVNKLPRTFEHQELVLIDKLYGIKDSDMIAACEEIMQMSSETGKWNIKMFKNALVTSSDE